MLYFYILLVSCGSGLMAPDYPVAWLGEKVVDLGAIAKDSQKQHVFQFRNISDASLLIDNVRVGCGCTATDWETTTIAPGAVGSINVSYSATNRGFFRKYIKVYFKQHRGGHKLWLEGFVEDR